MDFVAIDVETANSDMASICQIGIAKYKNGSLAEEWVSLINPDDYFDWINVGIHGIDEDDVSDAPTLPEVVADIIRLTSGATCVCHTHFDRVSLFRAFNKYSLLPLDVSWLDSARIARRTWKECAWRGYGLANVCKIIDYKFKHHDALEDAKACGQIILEAIRITGLDIEDWAHRVSLPIDLTNNSSHIAREGNPEGELFGETLVFTGALQVPRVEAAKLAASIGCKVGGGVTKATTLLIVGDQDVSKFAGKEKSSKHLKAEQLISRGQAIRILKESDFVELVNHSHEIA